MLSVGGPTPNRFDVPSSGAPTTTTYDRQLGNLLLNFDTDEIAFFAQDSWRLTPNFTVNYGVRWEGAFNPTPEANNDFMLNAVRGFTFPLGRTIDPTQIPDQLNQWGPRLGFAWDPTGDGRTVVRGHSGLYYARTPALLWAAPMNNFRVPPGDLSVRLPLPRSPITTNERSRTRPWRSKRCIAISSRESRSHASNWSSFSCTAPCRSSSAFISSSDISSPNFALISSYSLSSLTVSVTASSTTSRTVR